MAKLTEIRLTLAAFIYSIELDLKQLITTYIASNFTDLSFLGDNEYVEKIKFRFLKDFPGINVEENILQVVDYIDFQDSYTIILKNKNFVPSLIIEDLKKVTPKLNEIVPIRNRVMHTRPLLVGDFSEVYIFINEIEELRNITWSTTLETKRKIEEDPSYVLTLSIPSFRFQSEEPEHNLPLPDFDETGFIGRKKDIEDIKRLILGNNRVVSIIGDGGIGKTALALKVAYDIVDLKDDNPFDLIIWISAKTTMLTSKGIKEIENSLKDYAGVIEGISEFISIDKKTSNEKLNEILEYLDVFDILLIIDNLETILDEDIREFIRQAQLSCKIMITSRIGLGELEFRRTLSGLSESESITLLRQFANMKQSKIISRFPNEKIVEIINKLHYNPLAIKWFVNTVETGVNPDEVLAKKDDLLNFCLSNVYTKLEENARQLIGIILASRKSLNEAELIFLSNLPSIVLRKTLNELFSTTFIAREIENVHGSQEVRYAIPDFAREYLLKRHPIKTEFIKTINRNLKALSIQTEQIKRVSQYNEFGLNALTIRNTTEKVTARLLTEALKFSKRGNLEDSLLKIEEAKSILPNYFEVYRVSAFVKATFDDYLGAEQDYKTGIEIEPDNPRLLYFYSGFLLYQLSDHDNALPLAKKLMALRPNSIYPTFLYTRCLSVYGRHEDAIQLLKDLINNTPVNDESKRIAVTDLISQHCHWGIQIVQKDGDFDEAKSKFLKSLSYFERMVKERNHDVKMIKNFCTAIISFIKYIPKIHNEENIEYLRELAIRYNDYIALNNSKSHIDYLLKEYYDVDLSVNAPKYEGKIDQIKRHLGFAFIKVENGSRYYANKNVFNLDTWNVIRLGDKVNFDIGTNSLGECAINVTIN